MQRIPSLVQHRVHGHTTRIFTGQHRLFTTSSALRSANAKPSPKAEPAQTASPTWVLPSLATVTAGVLAANIYFYLSEEPNANRVMPLEFGRFNNFTLLEVIPVTHDTSLFRFRAAHQIPDSQNIPIEDRKSKSKVHLSTNEYVPAPNHIIIKDDTCQVGRSYTPITYGRDYFDLLVKKYPNGSVSSMIHSLEPGKDFIIARGPVLSFPYTQNMTEKLVMIAGGTGITPMYQLIKQILRDPHDKTSINLVYGSKTESDILLGNELHVLQQKFPERLQVHHVIQNGATNVSSRGYGAIHGGIIDEKVLKECGVAKPEEEPVVLVCGPDGMVEWLAGEKKSENNQGPLLGVLKRAGYTPQQVFKF
ncbi:NADH-cytochrome b5 reductase [Rhizoclosmatium sp. JEL0117]|nr:NADH-cytochrome b5 reductase [Rhizoclosmatium sp. JEL0117]